MNNFFSYDDVNGQIQLEDPSILLIKEFDDLMDVERNKCKADKTGKKKLRSFREFKYIYLCIYWNSPYRDFSERDRHEYALKDAELTEEEFNDPVFRAACRKFKELQESHRSIRLLQAAQRMADKFIDYFDFVDPTETDDQTGKPIYDVSKLQAQIANLHKVHEELMILEDQVKKEISEKSSIKGDAEDGYLPDDL